MYAFLSKEIFLRISPIDFSSYFIGQNYLMCLCLSKRKTITKTGCFNQVLFLKQKGWLLDRQPTSVLLHCLFSNVQKKKKVYCAPIMYVLRLWRYWHHNLMSITTNLEPKCWRSWLTERRCWGNVLWSMELKGKVELPRPGSFMARKWLSWKQSLPKRGGSSPSFKLALSSQLWFQNY